MTCHAPAQPLAAPLRCTSWFTLLAALLIFGLLADGTASAQGNSGNAPGQNKDKNDDDGGGDDGGGDGGGDDSEPEVGVRYDFYLLPTFGGDMNIATDINQRGDIVGDASVDGETHRDGMDTTLDERRGYVIPAEADDPTNPANLIHLWDLLSDEDKDRYARIAFATAINDVGQIVARARLWDHVYGERRTAQLRLNAMKWVEEELVRWDSWHDLDEVFVEELAIDDTVAHPRGINVSGDITGHYHFGDGWFAFLLSPDEGLFENLGAFDGHKGSRGEAINSWGQVAGTSESRAFVYDVELGMRDLGVLGPASKDSDGKSAAFGMNDFGDVVGWSNAGYRGRTTFQHAFRWRYETDVMEDLGTLGGGAAGTGINHHDEVVGHYWVEFNRHDPFLYLNDHGMLALNDLVNDRPEGFHLVRRSSSTLKINDRGEILGEGTFTDVNGPQRSYVLFPVAP